VNLPILIIITIFIHRNRRISLYQLSREERDVLNDNGCEFSPYEQEIFGDKYLGDFANRIPGRSISPAYDL
jgi:hypothetical protein